MIGKSFLNLLSLKATNEYAAILIDSTIELNNIQRHSSTERVKDASMQCFPEDVREEIFIVIDCE